jgi:hypothetical protein
VIFLLFLFPAILGARNPLSESIFPLQTYYINHIGGVDSGFSTGKLGVDYETLGLNKTQFRKITDHPVRVLNPFWLRFVGSNYHFVLPRKLIFNFSSFLRIKPPAIFVRTIHVWTIRVCEFELTNMDDSPLQILEITTPSRDILLNAMDPSILRPGESLTVGVYLCPTSSTTFSALILIRTSRGSVPYCVTCRAMSSQKELAMPPLFYYSSASPCNITLRVPPVLQPQRLAVVYDLSIFDGPRCVIADRFVILAPLALKPGHYLTFVHMFNHGAARSFPLCIGVSPRLLQSFYPVIYLEVVTSSSGVSEADIRVYNPTPFSYTVLSVALPRDAPSNVRVEPLGLPLTCHRLSDPVVGRVSVSGFRVGEVETVVTVNYELADKKSEHSLEVPVKGWVEYGSFEPSESSINFLETDDADRSIYFTNHFSIPVVVVSARIEDVYIRVVGFTPFLVQPGDRSRDLRIKRATRHRGASFNTSLLVDTNATNQRIPIHGYSGQISISLNPSLQEEAPGPLVCEIGKALCGTSVSLNLYVRNPNPVPYVVTRFHSTDGVRCSGSWSGPNHTIGPFETELLTVKVAFNPMQHRGGRNDTLSLGSVASMSNVIIAWTPYPGAFEVSTTLPDLLTLGQFSAGSISVNSSYTIGRRVLGASSSYDFMEIHPVLTFIRPRILTSIATVSLLLTNAVVKDIPVFDNFQNITYQTQVWKEFWLAPIAVELDFECELNGDARVTLPFGIKIGRCRFDDVHQQAGYILLNVETTHLFEVTNVYECPVAFHAENFDEVISPHESVSIPVTFSVSAVGEFSFANPVTTNLTPPFYLHLSGIVVEPKLKFLNDQRRPITSVSFRDRHWRQVVYLKNYGKTGVYLNDIVSPSKGIHITSNCTDFLEKDAVCQLAFAVKIGSLENEAEFHELTVDAAGTLSTLDIRINLSKEVVEKLRRFRQIKHTTMIIVTAVLTVGRVLGPLIRGAKMGRKARARLTALPRAIDECSPSRRVSVPTEVIFTNDRTGGAWERAEKPAWLVTGEAIAAIESFIADLR